MSVLPDNYVIYIVGVLEPPSLCPSLYAYVIDLFTDMAAILNSIVSNSYYGILRGQISMYLPPEHPIIDI